MMYYYYYYYIILLFSCMDALNYLKSDRKDFYSTLLQNKFSK